MTVQLRELQSELEQQRERETALENALETARAEAAAEHGHRIEVESARDEHAALLRQLAWLRDENASLRQSLESFGIHIDY